VLTLYDIVASGGLSATGANWTCLANQKAALDTLQRNQMTFGGSCTRHWPESPSVPVQAKKRSFAERARRSEQDPPAYRSPTTNWSKILAAAKPEARLDADEE
jgi:hypothetical protein